MYSENDEVVVVWLKIGKHDICAAKHSSHIKVVVWLKIGKHDICAAKHSSHIKVVVWLKIGKHDILKSKELKCFLLWFD